ncbi:MAG: phosphatase PAP2 family protein [Clostridia bacterium]|nr:phosphatase PAP2 family protein [Clostridia bacterium]
MDLEILKALQDLRLSSGRFLTPFFLIISGIVTSSALYIPIAGIYWSVNKKQGTAILLSCMYGAFLNQLLKCSFCVYRPWVRDPSILPAAEALAESGGYSFPSGHTSLAAAVFGSAAVWQKKRRWVGVMCGILILLVMLSRVYLGVHTPQDVLAALAVTLVLIPLAYRLTDICAVRRNADIAVAAAGVVSGVLMLLYISLKAYPADLAADGSLLVDPREMIIECYSAAGAVIALSAGWLIERRLIRFETDGISLRTGLCRFAAGAAGIAALILFVKKPLYALLGQEAGHFAFYFTVFLYVTVIHPAVFTAAERRFGTRLYGTGRADTRSKW